MWTVRSGGLVSLFLSIFPHFPPHSLDGAQAQLPAGSSFYMGVSFPCREESKNVTAAPYLQAKCSQTGKLAGELHKPAESRGLADGRRWLSSLRAHVSGVSMSPKALGRLLFHLLPLTFSVALPLQSPHPRSLFSTPLIGNLSSFLTPPCLEILSAAQSLDPTWVPEGCSCQEFSANGPHK